MSARGNQLPPIYSPSYEFTQPEYIQEQRSQLNAEIYKLKSEIQPLTRLLHAMQHQVDQQQTALANINSNKGSEELDPQNWLSPRIAQLHSEYDSLSAELARLRRLYCEQSEFKLRYDIEHQRQELNEIIGDNQRILENVRLQEMELSDLMQCETTKAIQDQTVQIENFRKLLSAVNQEERQMINQYMDTVNEVSEIAISEQILLNRKKKLLKTEKKKLTLKQESRKLQKFFEARIKELEDKIESHELLKKRRASRDDWKQNLQLSSSQRSLSFASYGSRGFSKKVLEDGDMNTLGLGRDVLAAGAPRRKSLNVLLEGVCVNDRTPRKPCKSVEDSLLVPKDPAEANDGAA